MMKFRKNIKLGKVNFLISFLLIFFYFIPTSISSDKDESVKKYTKIKILDKISSKNISVKLINGENFKYSDLLIKSIKCKHSEFDDDPEIIAYVQVRDLSNKKNDEVYVFNGWMFSSSPSINPFDHPVYDIWLIGCD
ncbi:MAG: hypothetical protein CNB62_01650 [Pelagibacterales bacterium MED-G44]|nr:MAG: hypothetical protein CNB62_01650 [Pelagibacterales bacterium MED-G44]